MHERERMADSSQVIEIINQSVMLKRTDKSKEASEEHISSGISLSIALLKSLSFPPHVWLSVNLNCSRLLYICPYGINYNCLCLAGWFDKCRSDFAFTWSAHNLARRPPSYTHILHTYIRTYIHTYIYSIALF